MLPYDTGGRGGREDVDTVFDVDGPATVEVLVDAGGGAVVVTSSMAGCSREAGPAEEDPSPLDDSEAGHGVGGVSQAVGVCELLPEDDAPQLGDPESHP